VRFLVIEGVDGAGKSTVARAVCAFLSEQGQAVLTLREPGSTAVGERVREILLDPRVGELDPWTEAALFTACRAQMVCEIVRPALDEGRTVVMDRYFYSTVCYQGYAGGIETDLLFKLSEQAVGRLQPDRVILLDLPAARALDRLSGAQDRMEAKGEAYMERVRQGYLQLARRDAERWTVLDATVPEDQVIHCALAALRGNG
jgi:dTMP kinase